MKTKAKTQKTKKTQKIKKIKTLSVFKKAAEFFSGKKDKKIDKPQQTRKKKTVNKKKSTDIADEHNIDPSHLVQQEDLEVHIAHWLESLSERERAVIVRRFGLQGYDRGTLEEVGEAIGLTRERVRQLQIEGLKKLRHLVEAEGLTKEDSAE